MLKNMSVWQIWGLALSLIAFDFALISLYFGQPVVLGTNDTSNWDFRIAELRQLDVKPESAVAGVSISRESVEPTPTPTPSPSALQNVLPSSTAPVVKPWQMPFGSIFGAKGTTEADDRGQVL